MAVLNALAAALFSTCHDGVATTVQGHSSKTGNESQTWTSVSSLSRPEPRPGTSPAICKFLLQPVNFRTLCTPVACGTHVALFEG